MKKLSVRVAAAAFLTLTPAAFAGDRVQALAATYSETPWLRGTFNSWGKTPLLAAETHTPKGLSYIAYVNVPESGHAFKIDTSLDGDWTSNYGDKNPSDPCLDAQGENIPFSEGRGTYVLRYSVGVAGSACDQPFITLKKLNAFNAVYRTMYLRTSLLDWGMLPMVLVRDHVWETSVDMKPNSSAFIKFDVNGDWNVNFGRPKNSDIAKTRNGGLANAQDGDNLELQLDEQAGVDTVTLKVRFHEQSKEFAVCPNVSRALCR